MLSMRDGVNDTKGVAESEQFTDSNTSNNQDKKDAKLDILAKEEQRVIRFLRGATTSVLLLSSVAMCLLAYLYLTHEETKQLKQAFEDHASKVVSTFSTRLADRVSAIDYLSASLISHSISMKIEWPKLFLPHFEVRGNKTNSLAGTISITVLPIVTNETRPAYEGFSNMMQRWVPEGLGFQKRWDNASWTFPQNWDEQVGTISPTITSLSEEGEQVAAMGQGPFLPRWQSSPAIADSSYVSLDLLSHPAYKEVLEAGLESGRVLFGKSFVPFENDSEEEKHGLLKAYLNRWEEAGIEYKGDAITDLVFPLYDDFFGEPKLVGLFHSHVYWHNYFTNTLPEGDGPLVAFLSNSCGQTFTFEIDGSGVTYHGNDKIFDDSKDAELSTETQFSEMMAAFAVDETLPGECSYTLSLQASPEMESRYKTSKPRDFTLAIAVAVLFTSFTFLAYDYLIERRQEKVLQQALKSGAIVSSLFPKAVRARMYAEAAGQTKDGRLQDTLLKKDVEEMASNDTDPKQLASDPVADLYPDCTILFADVVGFTSWSAAQSPTAVFKLLETIYFNFDRIARKLEVFKVETIGDCYVAATGLPNAQPRHAIIMAQFANECMFRLHSLLPELEETLGKGVLKLSMRFGLHSGSVTAGVLRGDRARFQLFGDCVNTAARMEANGVAGRIHVSESTAQLVRQAGYHKWIVRREDKVIAKGLGEMQTYFLIDPATNSIEEEQSTSETTA